MIAYNYDIPVIASNLDGFREFIVDGETGFFFDSEDENSLARVLELAILRNEAEYNLLVKNVANYKNEKYEASIIAQKYNNLFLEIFAQQKK